MKALLISNMTKKRKILLLSTISFFFYCVLILISPNKLIYDEVYYVSIAKDYAKVGFTQDFIKNISAPTGILYSLIHSLFEPWTSYSLPQMRFVNIFLLLGCYVLTFIWLQQLKNIKAVDNNLLNSSMWLFFPTTGVIACMALTEISAIFFCILSTLILTYAYNKWDRMKNLTTFSFLVISGILLGISTWGRQNLIVLILAAFPFIMPLTKRTVLFFLAYTIPALLIFIYPIFIWGGFVPPTVHFVEEGYRLVNFFLSFSYLGFISILVFPRLFILNKQSCTISFILSLLLVIIFKDLRFVPSQFFVKSLLGETVTLYISYFAGLISTSLAILFLYSIFKESMSRKNDPIFLFCVISILLIGASNVKISHQFSSRYITLSLPFLIGVATYKGDKNISLKRLLFSYFLSIFFILNYYDMLPL